MDLKLCRNCRWVSPVLFPGIAGSANTNDYEWYCRHPDVKPATMDYVLGEHLYQRCSFVREGQCGPSGRLFESRPLIKLTPPVKKGWAWR